MQAVLRLLQVEVDSAADALFPEGDPLEEQVFHAEDFRHAGDEHVEVAGERLFERSHLVELPHEFVGVGPALHVDRDLETALVGLVADVRDLPELARLGLLDDLVDDGLGHGGRRDLRDVDAVVLLVVGITRADRDAAPAGVEDVRHLVAVIDDHAAAREVGRLQVIHDVDVRVLDEGHGRLTDLLQVEGADGARHADGDAHVVVDEDAREGDRQQGRLLHGGVVVVDEVDGVFIDVPEEFRGDLFEFGFRVSRSRPGHVSRVGLTEVALRVDIRMEQCFIAAGQSDHGVVDGRVAVGVQLHRAADDVRRLDARTVQAVMCCWTTSPAPMI